MKRERHTEPWIAALLVLAAAAAALSQLFCPQPAAALKPWDRPAWNSGQVQGDGHDTRAEILAERCSGVTWRGGTVLSATCKDQYSGEISTRAGTGWQIDHAYAAVTAWRARAWRDDDGTICRRAIGCAEFLRFFNDKMNLQITTAHENLSKSDRGPAGWCPALRGARILLAVRYRSTARYWRLPISAADRAGLDAWARGECVAGGGR